MDHLHNKPDGSGMAFGQSTGITWFFQGIHSSTLGEYIAGLIFAFFLAGLYEFASWLNRYMEERYVKKKEMLGKNAVISTSYYFALPFSYLLKQTTGYMLMLLIMTFNYVLFFVIILSRVLFNHGFLIKDELSKEVYSGEYQPTKQEEINESR